MGCSIGWGGMFFEEVADFDVKVWEVGCAAEPVEVGIDVGEDDDLSAFEGAFGLLMRDIFGGKHRCISDKALRKDAAKRYANVEQMQKAFKRTHSIPLVAAAVLLFLATLTPYFFIKKDGRSI